MQTFGFSRQPLAILEYATTLSRVDPATKECLARYVRSVCAGTFKQERYRTDINPHLRQLEQVNPSFFTEWKKGQTIQIEKNLTLVDTDDPYDLLLCGTEGEQTCQHIKRDSFYSKSLLGYLMNGGIRMIAYKKESLQARAILRILWKNRQPVLFLEKLYGPYKYHRGIEAFAKERAKQLKMDLYQLEGNDELNKTELHSLKGAVPWEHSDGIQAISPYGQFKLKASLLFKYS